MEVAMRTHGDATRITHEAGRSTVETVAAPPAGIVPRLFAAEPALMWSGTLLLLLAVPSALGIWLDRRGPEPRGQGWVSTATAQSLTPAALRARTR